MITKEKSSYDNLSRKELLTLLKYRDETIQKLYAKTIDDYVRDLIENAMSKYD